MWPTVEEVVKIPEECLVGFGVEMKNLCNVQFVDILNECVNFVGECFVNVFNIFLGDKQPILFFFIMS
jgi:hypothetical protein